MSQEYSEDKRTIVKLFLEKLDALRFTSGWIDEEHFDVLLVYFEAAPDAFPAKIASILQHPGSNEGLRRDSINRMSAILRATAEIPKSLVQKTVAGANTDLVYFELNEEDSRKILDLCTQIRKIVWATSAFDAPHRNRLLKRISAIETEVHKKHGLFDVVLGGVSDFGETLGKFGKDIKPLTDRVAEIAKIARKNTEEYSSLPAPEDVKRLPPPPEEQE
ncbi:hypothetical protein [uncultured Gemmobacter sp.]|uniref:hypothetical protein n=1 Tax=uncultured Gemmobacter sp. TaxID=1095917 RepID=UPI000ACDB25B|nr:hypothetical protein [uncultured Gemmobacter sp.]